MIAFRDGLMMALSAATAEAAAALWSVAARLEGAPTVEMVVASCLRQGNVEAAGALAPYLGASRDDLHQQGERLALVFPMGAGGIAPKQHENEAALMKGLLISGLVSPAAYLTRENTSYTPLAWLLTAGHERAAQTFQESGCALPGDLDQALMLLSGAGLDNHALPFLVMKPRHLLLIQQLLDAGAIPDGAFDRHHQQDAACAALDNGARWDDQPTETLERVLGAYLTAWTQDVWGSGECPMARWLAHGGDSRFAMDQAKNKKTIAQRASATLLRVIATQALFSDDALLTQFQQALTQGDVRLAGGLGEPDAEQLFGALATLPAMGLVATAINEGRLEQVWDQTCAILDAHWTGDPAILSQWASQARKIGQQACQLERLLPARDSELRQELLNEVRALLAALSLDMRTAPASGTARGFSRL